MKLKSMMLTMLLLAAVFSGCVDKDADVVPTPTPEPTQTPQPTPTAIPTPTMTPQPTPEPTPTATVKLNPPKPIYIQSNALTPRTPTIRVGEALNWINLQEPYTTFTLVSEDGLWENKSIGPSKKFAYTFTTPGNYSYYCPGYGNSMRGTVTVTDT